MGYLFSNIEGTRPALAGDDPQAATTSYPVSIGLLTAFDGIHSRQNVQPAGTGYFFYSQVHITVRNENAGYVFRPLPSEILVSLQILLVAANLHRMLLLKI